MPHLDPALLARIADLEFAARLIVEGARLGAHRSAYVGTGAEFQQMRPYLPGDDVKFLDWKHYARTDRLFTRVHRRTSEWPVMIALDTSGSMGFAGADGVTKLRMATLLAAALAYLLIDSDDAAGLVTHADAVGTMLPARTGRPHLLRVLGTLQRTTTQGLTDLAATVRHTALKLGRRGMIVLISDLYDEDGWQRATREVRQMGHEVALLHVLAPGELTLEARGDLELVDLETGARVVAQASALKPGYDSAMAEFVARQRSTAEREGMTYVEAFTDTPPDAVLRALSQARARQGGPSW
jgi:uncharacterized protein (DUF58 family)